MADELRSDLEPKTGAARLGLPPEARGVFPNQHLLRAVHLGMIDGGKYKIPDSSFQPASLDLRLGDTAATSTEKTLGPIDSTLSVRSRD